MRVARLDVEASVDARKSGDMPKMTVPYCRSMTSGEIMRVQRWGVEARKSGDARKMKVADCRPQRLNIEVSVDRQRCSMARKSGDGG